MDAKDLTDGIINNGRGSDGRPAVTEYSGRKKTVVENSRIENSHNDSSDAGDQETGETDW